MRPTILLTGKTGQLGSELNRLLPKLGEVIAPERNALDLREPEKICQVMRNANPQLVINAAAYTAVDTAETDEANAFAVNAEAPRLLALEAKKIGAMLVHFSTDYVFDGSAKAPYEETDPTNPINVYGKSKLLRLATEREELKIVRDQIGAPTCAVDIAAATAKVLTNVYGRNDDRCAFSKVSGTYHMTAAGETTWYDFTKAILEEARRGPQNLPWLASATKGRPLIARHVVPISTEEFRSPTRRPAYSVLSNARLKQVFGVTLPDWRTQLHQCFANPS